METMAARSVTRSCLRFKNGYSTSAARAFLLVSSRRQLHSAPAPLLDFLVPSAGSSPAYVQYQRDLRTRGLRSRGFTSCAVQRTSAIVNPRKDDDGNDMIVEITPRASNVCLVFFFHDVSCLCLTGI